MSTGFMSTFTREVIERHIAAGRLSPGARGMRSAEALRQHNQACAATPADPEYLLDPDHAQGAARLALRLANHEIRPGCTIVLTDAIPGHDPGTDTYAVSPSQVEFALDHLRGVTGDDISAAAVVAALPWEYDCEDLAAGTGGAA